MEKIKNKYRILTKDRRIKFTGGTNVGSWFSLEKAKKLVNYENKESIYEYDTNGDRLWEIL